jgi:hypothetical protein
MTKTITNVAADPTAMAERAKQYSIQDQLLQARRDIELASQIDDSRQAQFDVAVDRVLGIDVEDAPTKPNISEAMARYRVLATALERQRRTVLEAETAASRRIAQRG